MKNFIERSIEKLEEDVSLAARIKVFSLDPEARHLSQGPLLLVLPAGTRLIRRDETRSLLELEALVEVSFHRFQGGANPAQLLAEFEDDIRSLLSGSRLTDGEDDYLDEAPLTILETRYDFPMQDGKSTDPPFRLQMRLSGGRFIQS